MVTLFPYDAKLPLTNLDPILHVQVLYLWW